MAEPRKRPGPVVRKKEIIEAAIEEFGSKNYNWATTKDIAQRAGVSERVVFFYFNSKKELYRQVTQQITMEVVGALVRGRPPTDDLRTYVKMGIRNFIDFLVENPLKVKLLMQSFDTVADPDLREDFVNLLQGLYQFVHSFLRDAEQKGQIPEELIETASLCLSGMCVVVVYAEYFGLDWFHEEHEDIFSIGDRFVDLITSQMK